MDSVKTGRAIKVLRQRIGFTQQDLAKQLNVTDKAVSKWERGISAPDISIITKLAELLNADVDNILYGNVSYLNNTWCGVLNILDENSDVHSDTMIYSKPAVYIWISYFLLAGIRDIIILCNDFDKKYIESTIGDGKCLGVNILCTKEKEQAYLERNTMVVYDKWFVYGANLTRYFHRAMSRKNGITILGIPKKKGLEEFMIKIGHNKQLQEKHLYDNEKYYCVPIIFYPKSFMHRLNGSFDRELLQAENLLYAEPMGNGMIDYPMYYYEDIYQISTFIYFVENATGNSLYDINEIASKRGLMIDN